MLDARMLEAGGWTLIKYLITITYNSPTTNPIKLRPVTVNVTGRFLYYFLMKRFKTDVKGGY